MAFLHAKAARAHAVSAGQLVRTGSCGRLPGLIAESISSVSRSLLQCMQLAKFTHSSPSRGVLVISMVVDSRPTDSLRRRDFLARSACLEEVCPSNQPVLGFKHPVKRADSSQDDLSNHQCLVVCHIHKSYPVLRPVSVSVGVSVNDTSGFLILTNNDLLPLLLWHSIISESSPANALLQCIDRCIYCQNIILVSKNLELSINSQSFPPNVLLQQINHCTVKT